MSPPGVHPAALEVKQLLAECDSRRVRRSGPGGQRRNKVETAVLLYHRPTGISAEAGERRSQAENRSVAVSRLRINLALQFRRPCGADAPPSPLWRSRCRGERLAVGRSHVDFPAILAEALDRLAGHGDVKAAAGAFGCTASQLVKLLKKEPRALALVNRWRNQSGLRPLQ